MSLLLRELAPLLPLIAAVAVCDVAGAHAQIKWPNDVVLDSPATSSGPGLAKLAGILVEGRPQERWAVLGIGLNIAVRIDELPPELRPDAPDAMRSSTGMPAATMGMTPADVEPTLTQLLHALEQRLSEPAQSTLRAWRAKDALRGREIAWGTHGVDGPPQRGQAEGIDGTGRLIVALADGGRTTIGAGEVHLQKIS
jgi:BirA family transcriptional regulator, biotin operon repressor / biotin---[acetyl-CoA-carboxylase] ligase